MTWRKDGRHISAHRRYRYHNYHSQLSIADVQSSDEATYTCRGTNDHGSVEQKIFLDVQGINHNVSSLRCPRIGQGLDIKDIRLTWDEASKLAHTRSSWRQRLAQCVFDTG